MVPPYEYGELVLKNYRTNIEKTQPGLFTSCNSLDVNEPTDFTRDVVYSEVYLFDEAVELFPGSMSSYFDNSLLPQCRYCRLWGSLGD